MDFDGTLGGAVLGPVEDLGAEVDDGAVQAIEFAGVQQRGLGVGRQFGAEVVQQIQEQILIDFPRAVLIGVGQRGVFGGFTDAEMDQFAFAGLEAFVDFAEALGLAELAEEHSDELVPAAETAGVAFALMAADDLFKHRPGDQMKKLAENAGYLRQGWGPRRGGVDSCRNLLLSLSGPHPSGRYPNLDTSDSK